MIGLAGRFPGAPSIAKFWDNLVNGVSAVQHYSHAELLAAGESPLVAGQSDYVAAGAPLADIEHFDAEFFGLSQLDASVLDPQHRLFLEVCWEALEDGGYASGRWPAPVGVFGGAGRQSYFTDHVLRNQQLVETHGDFYLRHTGNDKDFLCSRVSYALDLGGPSLTVQAACSTSLVAVHLAAQSLLAGECGLALAGGVSLLLPHRRGYRLRENGVAAADGVCRAFSADGSGTVFGSGAGVVLLRRLADAIADRDAIRAVLRGSAVNNDGARKVSYFAPSVDAQAACVAEAIGVAGISPDSISYVEAHGTGTHLGDPVEIQALTQAFGSSTGRRGFCAIGSVKPSIGHLDTAAGVASLIKTVLALEHRTIPASLHAEPLNPLCDFAATPFVVATATRAWDTDGRPRRAGVNSLGIGGTNAHVVLEEAPPRMAAALSAPAPELVCLSARSPAALAAMTARLADHLATAGRALDLQDVAFTLQQGRRAFPWRRSVVAGTIAQAVERLRAAAPALPLPPAAAPLPVAFLFGGSGSEYVGAGRGMGGAVPDFGEHYDRAWRALDSAAGRALTPRHGDAGAPIDDPLEAVAAVFALEYAMSAALRNCGVVPTAVIGHSAGELVAAAFTGMLSLEAAARLVVARGRALSRISGGGMLAVSASVERVRAVLGDGIDVAAVNGEHACVVSGPQAALSAAADRLRHAGLEHQLLPIATAAHSALLDPLLAEYGAAVRREVFAPPSVPMMSTLTARWLSDAEAVDPDYWVRQLRDTVRYRDAAQALRPHLAGGLVVDLGAGRALAGQLMRHEGEAGARAVASPLRRAADARGDDEVALEALGAMWAGGLTIDWSRLHRDTPRRRVPLPTYPFERRRCWIDPPAADAVESRGDGRLPSREWFGQPVWKESAPPRHAIAAQWLVVGADGEPASVLDALGGPAVTVIGGTHFETLGDGRYQVRLDAVESWQALLRDLERRQRLPDRIAYAWGMDAERGNADELAGLDDDVRLALLGPASLAAAWAGLDIGRPFQMATVSWGRHRLDGASPMRPAHALSMGPALVIPQELPGARLVDIDCHPGDAGSRVLLARELAGDWSAPVVALRSGARFVPDRVSWPAPATTPAQVRPGGVYLVTGGLGHIGRVVADTLDRLGAGTIVSIGRHGAGARGRGVEGPTGTGAVVETIVGDVADLDGMRRVIDDVRRRHGAIHGVVHAAGVLDDAPLQMKTADDIRRVIAPKVRGTLVLDTLLATDPLDFFVVCSSISATEGAPGQIDYAAASAFLNAFAQSRHRAGTRPVVAVDWGPWAGGMSAAAVARADVPIAPLPAGVHPLLGAGTTGASGERVFTVPYDVRRLWVLGEHRVVDGAAVLPATAYVELIHAATATGAPLRIKQLDFLAPLVLEDGERSMVRVGVHRDGAAAQVVVESLRDHAWTVHVRAEAAPLAEAAPPLDLGAVRGRCQAVVAGATGTQDAHVRFGSRWKVLRSLRLGDGEAVADCTLPDAFAADLDEWRLHPALLDVAAHAGLALLPGLDPAQHFYVPVSIGRVQCHASLPRDVVSHVRLVETSAHSGMAVFDIAVVAADGRRLVDLVGFVLKRVTAGERRRLLAATPGDHESPARRLARRVASGIQPAEGEAAFARLLTGEAPPVVVISPFAPSPTAVAPAPVAVAATSPAVAATSGASSLDEIERTMTAWWTELLGGHAPGRDDDFFALGGHSLMALWLFNRIRRAFNVDLGLAALVQSSTIASLAARVRSALPSPGAEAATAPAAALPPEVIEFRASGSRPPLFLLAGVGGNVVGFRGLVDRLPADLPVYGLQAVGLDGGTAPLTDVPSMAAHFIAAIRRVQPRGPYHLTGFSAGGLIAYEMAQQLRAAHEEIALLGALDSMLEYASLPPKRLAEHVALRVGFQLRRALFHVAHAGSSLRYVRAHLQRVARSTMQTSSEGRGDHRMPAAYERVLAATRAAVQAYRPRPYDGVVVLFRAEDRGLAGTYSSDDNWRWLAAGGLTVVPVPGDHLSLLSEPNIATVAARLTDVLDEAHARAPRERPAATGHGEDSPARRVVAAGDLPALPTRLIAR